MGDEEEHAHKKKSTRKNAKFYLDGARRLARHRSVRGGSVERDQTEADKVQAILFTCVYIYVVCCQSKEFFKISVFRDPLLFSLLSSFEHKTQDKRWEDFLFFSFFFGGGFFFLRSLSLSLYNFILLACVSPYVGLRKGVFSMEVLF